MNQNTGLFSFSRGPEGSRFFFTVATVSLLTIASALVAEPARIAGNRQVFIDGRFLQDARGVKLTVHAPVKTGEPSIKPDQPWEGGLGSYASVLKNGDTYHLWYRTGRAILYARSTDGIHWDKPRLGLAEYQGSRDNNIVIGHGTAADDAGQGPQVFIDPKAPADQRFRLNTRQNSPGFYVDMFSSPDGIRWTLTHKDILKYHPFPKPHHLDSQNVIFWDDRINKYVAYMRANNASEGTQGRAIARSESSTLDGFAEAQDALKVMKHENEDLKLGGIKVVDYYTSAAIKYPWAQDAYYMFPVAYFHYLAGQMSEFPTEAPVNAGPLHTRFAASRDGVAWEQFDRRPFVSVGFRGEFDSMEARVFYGLVPSLDGRQIYMYYLGTDRLHGWGRDDKNNDLLTKAGLAPGAQEGFISRLVLRMDGFVSARFDYTGGEFTTEPLIFQGSKLVLNLDTSATGIGRVEILGSDGKPLDGFALADSDLIHTCNEINRTVTWKGSPDLSKLAGKPIRLHFVMRDCDLYAFQFVK